MGDLTIYCVQCDNPFTFTVDDQKRLNHLDLTRQKGARSAENANKSRPIRETVEAREAGSDMKIGKSLKIMNDNGRMVMI